jgi:hypothetical protein
MLTNTQVSRKLQESTSEHSIWAKQNSYLSKEAASTTEELLNTDELRKTVVREAIIDRRWRSHSPAPSRIRTFRLPPEYTNEIRVADILPGGEHMLIVLADGEFETRSLMSKYSGTNTTKKTDTRTRSTTPEMNCELVDLGYNQIFVCMSSERDGYFILELVHGEQSDHQ